MKNQSIKNYATLFLSWMPFNVVTTLQIQNKYEIESANGFYLLVIDNFSVQLYTVRILALTLEFQRRVEFFQNCDRNAFKIDVFSEYVGLNTERKENTHCDFSRQDTPNICLKQKKERARRLKTLSVFFTVNQLRSTRPEQSEC